MPAHSPNNCTMQATADAVEQKGAYDKMVEDSFVQKAQLDKVWPAPAACAATMQVIDALIGHNYQSVLQAPAMSVSYTCNALIKPLVPSLPAQAMVDAVEQKGAFDKLIVDSAQQKAQWDKVCPSAASIEILTGTS